ncbi:MAG TPA: DUF4149 domain-containing protein [Thermoanaerobaculia bacterium]|nr:DUF4149 domain-containing protein [Thermoanaerobaculia bacterium]
MRAWILELSTLLYHLGLSVWIGGFLVLGALVAPALFRRLERPLAGEIFGGILRRFARVRLITLILVMGAAAARFALWELQVLPAAPAGDGRPPGGALGGSGGSGGGSRL